MNLRALLVSSAVAAVAAAVPARATADAPVPADSVESPEPAPSPARANVVRDSIDLEASLWPSERYGLSLPFVGAVQHRLATLPVGLLVGALAIPIGAESNDGQDQGIAWGNPTATLTYAVPTRAITPFIGLRISAPIASAGDANSDLIVERAGAARGYYDYELWSVGYLPLALPFGIEAQPLRSLWLRAAFAPELDVAIERWATTRGSLEGALEIEERAASGAGGGVVLRAVGNGVFRSPRDQPDSTQTSLEPYFVYDRLVLVRTGVMFALDPPLGFGRRGDLGVIALHVTLGLRLDALTSARAPRSAAR